MKSTKISPIAGLIILLAVALISLEASDPGVTATGKIVGRVIDKETGEGISTAAVQIVGTTQGALTKPNGEFMILSVLPGMYSLEARMVGYETLNLDSVKVRADDMTHVEVEMEASPELEIMLTVNDLKEIMEFRSPYLRPIRKSYESVEYMPVNPPTDSVNTTKTDSTATGKIAGRAIGKKSRSGLPSVAVQIVGTNMGRLTKPDGTYEIKNIPPGIYSLTAQLVGYQTIKVDSVEVVKNKITELNIKLHRQK